MSIFDWFRDKPRLTANPCSCGSVDLTWKNDFKAYWCVVCATCGFRASSRLYVEEAIKEWNESQLKDRNFNQPVPMKEKVL